jgi:hypothetical protein
VAKNAINPTKPSMTIIINYRLRTPFAPLDYCAGSQVTKKQIKN